LREKARVYLEGVTLDRRTEVVIDEADGEPEDPEGDVEGDEH
jgi:hypothetical protein